MNLEDLVTGTLAPEAAEEEASHTGGILAIWEEKITSGGVLHRGEGYLTRMRESEDEEFHYQASQLAALFLSFAKTGRNPSYSLIEQARSPYFVGSEIALRAAEYRYSGEGRDELVAFSRQALDNQYLEYFFADPAEQMVYLEGFWGEETAARLAALGGVQKSTARNWMKGARPASAMLPIRRATEILYHLRSSAGIEGDAAREWMDRKLPGGQSPFEIISGHGMLGQNYGSRYGSRKTEKDPLIVELEKLGIEAFSWTMRLQSQ